MVSGSTQLELYMAREVAAGVRSAMAARESSLVTGWALCALAGDTPEGPGPPESWDCDSPVACAMFPGMSGIPGLCQLWHQCLPVPPSVLAAGMGSGHPAVSCGAPAISSEPLSPRLPQAVSECLAGCRLLLAAALGMVARPAPRSPRSPRCRSGASRLAGVFIEQIAPGCFCCKASASESEDLSSTSRIAPLLSVALSSPALPRDYCASLLPCAQPCFLSHWSGFPYLGGERKCCMPLL